MKPLRRIKSLQNAFMDKEAALNASGAPAAEIDQAREEMNKAVSVQFDRQREANLRRNKSKRLAAGVLKERQEEQRRLKLSPHARRVEDLAKKVPALQAALDTGYAKV